MALPDSILNPIPGPNPSGQNLRYDPVYEKVKEARREEDELPQGEWSREVKVADPALVIKLTSEELCKRTKDLQLAAWLTEALVRKDGVSGLTEGLRLLRGLVENFWDTVYPEPEDGDVELRVAPLNWVGSQLDEQVRSSPLTRGGYGWLEYMESRAVGYEEACAGNEAKMQARQLAVAEHKLAPEAFDQDMNATDRRYYVELIKNLDQAAESLQSLEELCDQKAKKDSPSFGKLRTALEDLHSLATSFLKTKPDPAAAAVSTPEGVVAPTVESLADSPEVVAPARREVMGHDPVDLDEAIRRILSGIEYLRKSDPLNPAPYLAVRGLRWGELRAGGFLPNKAQLDPPASQTRQQLKHLALEGQWQELLDAVETGMALPCGKAWLDLQRYATKAFQELGSTYDPVAKAVTSSVCALISDLPELPQCVFLDDTPVANPETLTWLKEVASASHPRDESLNPPPSLEESEAVNPDPQCPDAHELALEAARSGRVQEGMEILSREIAQERSGRARFERKMQLAGLCLASGHETIA